MNDKVSGSDIRDPRELMNSRPRSFWRLALKYIIFIVVVIGLWAGIDYFATQQEIAKRVTEADLLARQIEQQEAARQAAIKADTYGGKTPQETLQLYIAAVEKGDYDLASKYFVLEKQSAEKSKLEKLSGNKDDFSIYLALLKAAKPNQDTDSSAATGFVMESKQAGKPSLFIEFQKYPNSIWKIVEI